jgi:peptidoglycan/LPS O-acetylase OafA/YrhL
MAFLGVSTRNGTVPIQRGGWLDALRFIMAFLMILYHYRDAGPVALGALSPVFDRGFLLTDFFLIDSGYVLARIYAEKAAAGRMGTAEFMRKRVLRVVPAHLIMSLLLMGVVGSAALAGFAPRHPEWFDWSQLPAQFFLVQAYGAPGGAGWNAPSWTLSALLGCYLLFPLLARLIARLSPWSALAAGAAVLLAADVVSWRMVGAPVYSLAFKYGMLRAVPLFVLGMALARFGAKVFIPSSVAHGLGLAAVLGLIVAQASPAFAPISLAMLAALIIAAGAIPVVKPSRLVAKAAVVSFSMYITNEVFRIAYFGAVNVLEVRVHLPAGAQWALWACGIGGALAAAFVFHYLADMPTQRALKGWATGRGRAGTADAAVATPV